MKTFKEFQFCWWMLIVIAPIMVAINIGVFNDSLNGVGGVPHLIFNITCIVIFVLFYAMTTRVEGDKINLRYRTYPQNN